METATSKTNNFTSLKRNLLRHDMIAKDEAIYHHENKTYNIDTQSTLEQF